MVFTYNINKEHSRPECELVVENPRKESKKRFAVNAVADTGADMTTLPISLIWKLGNLIEGDPVRVKVANGAIESKTTYIVNIHLESHYFPFQEVLSSPKEHALIGRDILNKGKAYFDAPQLCWHLNCRKTCSQNQDELSFEKV